MKYIDLHTHSTRSDGSLAPSEVVAAAKEAGLSAVALSDHDTTDGIAEAMAAGEKLGIEVIPAIELSASSETETHVLGYFIDKDSPVLREKLGYIRSVRLKREEEICEKLTSLGMPVSIDEVKERSRGSIVCRVHVARVMMDHGYVSSVKEAFEKYLSSGKVAFSPTQALSDVEAVRLIKDAGGLAFVAHLNQTRRSVDSLRCFLSNLKNEGLDGIEGYYTEYTPEMQQTYQSLARELGLILSGGSDFHGSNKPHISIGTGTGGLRVPYEVLEVMKERL